MVGQSFLNRHKVGSKESKDIQPKWNVLQTKKARSSEATQSLSQKQSSLTELKPRIWTSVSHFTISLTRS